MLPIPSILLDKVNQAMQTIGNNAEPKMTIIAQKAAKYLNQGSFLNPKTVRTENSLGPLDICIRREDKNQEPTEIVMAYILNGQAHVATLPYVHQPDELFTYQYTLGPASDVACDFDGRFELITDRTGIYFDTETIWSLVTFGEPYIVMVNSGFTLPLYQNQVGVMTLANADVVKCSLLRGWKSVSEILTDQGMICAYTKTDGKAYYRNYCEQEDGSFLWENEREITEFVPPVSNISLFRAADYRTGFLAEISGNIQMLLTARSWSGMAVLPEYITAGVVTASIDVIDIGFYEYKSSDEYILSSAYDANILVFGDVSSTMRDAWNQDDGTGEWGKQIILRWTDSVANVEANVAAFKLVDAYGTTFYPSAVAHMDYPNRILLTFADFNNASDLCTIHYTPGTLQWKDGASIAGDTITFLPQNLVPTSIPAPVLLSMVNTDNQTIILTFNRPIISIDPAIGITVSGFEPFASPEGELVATTYTKDSVTYADPEISDIAIDLTDATLDDTALAGSSIILGVVT